MDFNRVWHSKQHWVKRFCKILTHFCKFCNFLPKNHSHMWASMKKNQYFLQVLQQFPYLETIVEIVGATSLITLHYHLTSMNFTILREFESKFFKFEIPTENRLHFEQILRLFSARMLLFTFFKTTEVKTITNICVPTYKTTKCLKFFKFLMKKHLRCIKMSKVLLEGNKVKALVLKILE